MKQIPTAGRRGRRRGDNLPILLFEKLEDLNRSYFLLGRQSHAAVSSGSRNLNMEYPKPQMK
jgi:hypothetical protein